MLVAASLLLLSVVFEQFFIAPFFPMVEAAGSIRPMIVFLDIPLALPAIDWLPVTLLFCIFYAVVVGPRLSRTGQKGLGKRVWKGLTGWYLLLGCIAAGGGLYYLIEGYLPKQVANGIDSFGVRADLTLPYPSGELIHLNGAVIQFLFTLLGLHLMARRTVLPQPSAVAEAQAIINTPPPPQRKPTTTFIKTQRRKPVMAAEPAETAEPALPSAPASRRISAPAEPAPASRRSSTPADPTPESRRSPAPAEPAPATRRSSVSVTPPPTGRAAALQTRPAPLPSGPAFPGEPPTCRLTTPPPIAIVMPRAAPAVGKAHPCFVIGNLKPSSLKFTKSTPASSPPIS